MILIVCDMTNYVLKMYICKDDATTTSEHHDMIKEWYLNAILKHNKHIEESVYPDAGESEHESGLCDV